MPPRVHSNMKFINVFGRVWKRIPEQIRHLSVPLTAFIVVYILAERLLVPADFGLTGHYRASSPQRNADLAIKYAGTKACTACHGVIASQKKAGYHKGVACETCHKSAAAHVENPGKVKPSIPQGRASCLLCHEYLSSRPTGFPQVDSRSHNPQTPCATCHKGHDPLPLGNTSQDAGQPDTMNAAQAGPSTSQVKQEATGFKAQPPSVVGKCKMCHSKVAGTLAGSPHKQVACAECHQVSEQHFQAPRANLPKLKNASRDLCGSCHGEGSAASKTTPKVDVKMHNEGLLCWECHRPHEPEAK